MDILILIAVEEHLNRPKRGRDIPPAAVLQKVDPSVMTFIDSRLESGGHERKRSVKEPTIYEDAIRYIKRLNDPRFLRKSGGVKEATFYQYAYIDKSTWSDMKWEKITPSKKTLLKLILALRLSEEEAVALLAKGKNAFDPEDAQDQVILALVEMQSEQYKLSVDDMVEILDYYRANGPKPYDSIYDTPNIIAQRKDKAW